MIIHLGDVPASSTLYIPFATYDSNGASVTMSGLATSDILIYKNGSTTQRSSTNGFTLLDTDGIDFDTVTGLHGISIDLSDNTDAGFYAAGAFYWVVISTITVASQTVTLIAATFRIRVAENTAGYPLVDTAKLSGTTCTARDIGASVLLSTGTGTGQLDFTSGVVKANATQWLGGTIPAVNVTGVPLVDLKYTLGTISPATAGSVRADSVTGAVGSVTGAVGSVTGAVGSVASGGITAASIAADAIGASELAADAVAEIADAVWDEVASGHTTAGTFGQAIYIKRANTAAGGAATTITLDASASATDDFYNNDLIIITGGTGAGQARFISDYVGATKVATVLDTWFVNPDNTSVFIIQPFPPSDVTTSLASITSTLGTVNTNVSAVQAKTDSLTFTISNQVDANIQSVNDVTVTGTGASGNEWGP